MSDLVIRPTIKWIRMGYTISFILIIALVFAYNNGHLSAALFWPLLIALGVLMALWPIRLQIRRRFIKVTVAGDKLRYESGILSRTTRTIQINKVQDVCVTQTLLERMIGIGDISIETAGETSRLTVPNIDQPQAFADEIMDWARSQPQTPAPKKKERG